MESRKLSALLFQPLRYICCGRAVILKVEQELSFPVKAAKAGLVLALEDRSMQLCLSVSSLK